jgi:xanthine dehydrogenase accessory factor
MYHSMDYLDHIKTLQEKGQAFVLATVVRVEKPASTRPGAKAIITQDGNLVGWIGGSCTEPSVKRAASIVLKDGHPCLLRLCPPEKMGAGPQEGVTEVQITCASGGTLEIYLEPYLPPPHLMVVGHHAIADALVSLGKTLDYRVTVIGEGLVPERFPAADQVVNSLDFSQVMVTSNTYVVVASHGNYDELALESVLPGQARYVALVASKKRAGVILAYLQQSGLPDEVLARLKYPAGLDFGAVTPEEIALSILAEIIQVRRHSKQIEAASDVTSAGQPEGAIDPVCGMTVEVSTTRYYSTFNDKTYHFCSADCQLKFEKEPHRYIQLEPQGEGQ